MLYYSADIRNLPFPMLLGELGGSIDEEFIAILNYVEYNMEHKVIGMLTTAAGCCGW